MAKSSFPFDAQDTTEDQYTKLFAELQDPGVAGSADSLDLKVTAPGSGLDLDIAPGSAYIRGHFFESTAIEHVTLVPPASGNATHVVVLRLDPTVDTIDFAVVQGGAGAGYPSLANDRKENATGIFEFPLAAVQISSGTVSIVAGDITDERRFAGHRVGVWSRTNRRPSNPRVGELGFNISRGVWEYHTGAGTWRDLDKEPVGMVQMFAGATVPEGYLLCDGAEYLNVDYPDLFAAIGNTYGGTAGTTFRVPALGGRSPRGTDGTHLLGASGGSETKTLTTGNLPAHAHDMTHDHPPTGTSSGGSHEHTGYYSRTDGQDIGTYRTGAIGDRVNDNGALINMDGAHTHSVDIPVYSGSTGNAGSGSAFDVMNPWLALNFIIKT